MFTCLKRLICNRFHPNFRIDFENKNSIFIQKCKRLKKITDHFINFSGRNRTGKKMFLSMGGGNKIFYRHIIFNIPVQKSTDLARLDYGFKIIRVEYDPNRTSWIFLMEFLNSTKRLFFYTLATHSIVPNSFVEYGFNAKPLLGHRVPLSSIPIGTHIHSLEFFPNMGGKIARAAGTCCRLVKREDDLCLVNLPSGRRIEISSSVQATVGMVSNIFHNQRKKHKAGNSRWVGRRPSVRGVAKNPVDHPHGGRTKGGCIPKTPWGKLTRGVKTRSLKKRSLDRKLYK